MTENKTAPEVPHADLIARLLNAEEFGPEGFGELFRDAANALAALADTVPRHEYESLVDQRDRYVRRYTALADAERERDEARAERDEARAERDALAHVIEQVREQVRREDRLALTSITAIEALVTRAPAVSLALHDAEMKAQALDGAAAAMDADDSFRDPLRLKADWVRDRAAAIREEAK